MVWEVEMAGRFQDRREAGQTLARELSRLRDRSDVVVLGLPRGGVAVAHEVAAALGAPLDVFVVRKLGVPGHEELAMGAIASGGVRVLNEELVDQLGIDQTTIDEVAAREGRELVRREEAYRGRLGAPELRGRTAILVDDGIATGSTMRAAIIALKQHEPGRIVVASPVAAPSICRELRGQVDEVVCVMTPEPMLAIGAWYEDFAQMSDEEVRAILERSEHESPRAGW
jgi:putative phosphoribosyl transferase